MPFLVLRSDGKNRWYYHFNLMLPVLPPPRATNVALQNVAMRSDVTRIYHLRVRQMFMFQQEKLYYS